MTLSALLQAHFRGALSCNHLSGQIALSAIATILGVSVVVVASHMLWTAKSFEYRAIAPLTVGLYFMIYGLSGKSL